MYLKIVFSRDFDLTIFDGLNCRVGDKTVTAHGTLEELNAIIAVAEGVLGDRTIIVRRGRLEEEKETQT